MTTSTTETTPPPSPREVMTVDQLAEYFQVGPQLVYKLARSGTLPAFKVGDQWRFLKTAVDAWAAAESAKNVAGAPAAPTTIEKEGVE